MSWSCLTVVLAGSDAGGAIPEGEGICTEEGAVCEAHGDALHDALLNTHLLGHLQCLKTGTAAILTTQDSLKILHKKPSVLLWSQLLRSQVKLAVNAGH